MIDEVTLTVGRKIEIEGYVGLQSEPFHNMLQLWKLLFAHPEVKLNKKEKLANMSFKGKDKIDLLTLPPRKHYIIGINTILTQDSFQFPGIISNNGCMGRV